MDTQDNVTRRGGASSSKVRHGWCVGITAALLLSCAPAALHAEPSDKDEKIRKLESMMLQMQSQIRSLKAAVGEERVEGRRTREKVREVAGKGYAPVPYAAAIPEGATPVFVTADKKFQFGALTITPGGFIAAEGIYRTRTQNADIASSFANIPFGPQAGLSEQKFTARQSRAALLVEAPISKSMLASAYGEFDFQGSAVSSNNGETNSYVPRIRHLYATLDNSDYGMHFLAGQTFSLATLNSKGITPRNEVTPPTIDGQYVPGFVWRRTPGIRLTKDFGGKLWLSVAAENPQTSLAGCTAGQNTTTSAIGGSGVTCSNLGVGAGGNLNTLNAYSYNNIPDIIGKAAYEAKLGDRDIHLEGFGIYRTFTDRVTNGTLAAATSASNRNTDGYGVGGGLIVPVLPKKLDFQVSGMIGKGIGTYGSGQLNDTTFRADGSLSAIRQEMLLAGFTAHVTPAIDLYAFGGVEQQQPNYFPTNAAGTTFGGYGAPTANNSGCYNSVSSVTASPTIGGNNTDTTCAGNNKRLWEITAGMWDKIYKGSFGEARVGVQYEYVQRELFQGNGGGALALASSPKQNDQVVMTSFRYYPFQ